MHDPKVYKALLTPRKPEFLKAEWQGKKKKIIIHYYEGNDGVK